MKDEAASASLRLVKGLIWFKSGTATALAGGLVWAGVWNREPWMIAGLCCCVPLWFAGLAPVARKAGSLPPRACRRSRGLPEGFLTLLATGQFVGITLWWFDDLGALMIPANLALGTTILWRILLSKALKVPFHQQTSAALIAILVPGTLLHGYILMVLLAGASC